MCVIRGGRTRSGFPLETHAKREQQASRLFISSKGPMAGSNTPIIHVVHYIQYGQQQAVDSPSVGWSLLGFSVSPLTISPFLPFNDYVTRSVRGCGKVPFIRKNEVIK